MMITLASGQFGQDYVVEADDGRTILVQTDWDYPGLARAFGWSGKVNKRKYGAGAGAEIAAAREYIDANIGKSVRDRGMFYEDNPACGCSKAEAYEAVRGAEKARGKQVRKLKRAMGRAGQTFPNPTPMTYDQAYAYLLAHGFRPVPGSSRFENQAGDAGRIEPASGGRSGGDWIVDIEVGGGMQKYGGHSPRFDNPTRGRRAKPNPTYRGHRRLTKEEARAEVLAMLRRGASDSFERGGPEVSFAGLPAEFHTAAKDLEREGLVEKAGHSPSGFMLYRLVVKRKTSKAKRNPVQAKRPSGKGKRGVLFEVELDNRGEEGMVTATVQARGAARWAKQDQQSIGGARWEADGSDFAYAVIGDYPGLVDELLQEGYHLNLSKYG
jgi:hypothetical protein